MIVQNNSIPWVVLALVVMGGCILTGMLLGDVGPFNSETAAAKVQITQTQAAMNAHATQSALELAQTQQAPLVQQTAIVAQMTTVPLQQTATQVAGLAAVENAQIYATQTAIVINQQMNAISVGATATAIAQGQARKQATGVAGFAVVGVGALTLFVWIIVRAFAQVIHARAEEKMAQAQFLAEQRRMVSLRVSLQNHNGHKPSYPVPNSLMKKSGDIDKMPKAE